LAAACAQAVQEVFAAYEQRFREIAHGARARFLARDWPGSFADAADRLRLYTEVLDHLVARIRTLLGSHLCQHNVWAAIKGTYSTMISNSAGWEIAESFFNSLTRRVFATEGVDQTIEFVDTDFDAATGLDSHLCQNYSGRSLTQLLVNALTNSSGDGFPAEQWDDLATRAAAGAAMGVACWAASGVGSKDGFRLVACAGEGAAGAEAAGGAAGPPDGLDLLPAFPAFFPSLPPL
jgi:isocitrate dehydrogenase kinase/phosphatase